MRKNNVMLVQHHLRHNTIKEHTIIESSKEIPLERVLYVTPNYIQSEGTVRFQSAGRGKAIRQGRNCIIITKEFAK